MERLDGEVRDRVKAMSLWLVVGLTLLGVLLGLWALYVGFLRTTAVPSEVVSVSDDEREITVQYTHGSCQEPAGVRIEERHDAVVLTAYVTERAPLRGRDCTAAAVEARETVELDEHLGERELRTTP